MSIINSRIIKKEEYYPYTFSICTLVTNRTEYEEMLGSFYNAGFEQNICEYMWIDNSIENTFEAYAGLNRFLQEAKGEYIILCHQDILLKDHSITDLRDRISYIDKIDSKWAILSNAGGINLKHTSMHLIQGNGNILHEENLPHKAETVDENFIIVKNSANLVLSNDLQGFHLYGTDICLIADILGYNSYIIDFKIIHKSDGNPGKDFTKLKRELIKKYRKSLRARFIGTTITRFFISGNYLISFLGNLKIILFFARQFFKAFKSKRNYYR